MAKLSALSTSANVSLKIGPQTVSCPWLAYNHYGNSEVTLLIPEASVGFVPAQGVPDTVNSYFGSPRDMATLLGIPYLLPDAIRASLVPVRIYDGVSYDYRSIFTPSPVECSSADAGAYKCDRSSAYGTAFATLKSKIDANANFQMRGHISGTDDFSGSGGGTLHIDSYLPLYLPQTCYIQYYSSTGRWGVADSRINGHTVSQKVEGKYGDPLGYQNSINPSQAYSGGGGSNMYDAYLHASTQSYLLITLDGNCEVTGSGSNWTLSRGGQSNRTGRSAESGTERSDDKYAWGGDSSCLN